MGFDLISESGASMHLTIWGYPDLMDLAVAHGWKPQGTTDCLLGTEFTAGKTEPDEI